MAMNARESQRSLDETFSTIVEDYSGQAYHVALGILRKPEDAEEAVQEAFLSAYRAFGAFKGQSKVSTWLYRIVVNACLMKIRRDKRPSEYLTETGYDDVVVRDWTSDPEAVTLNGELRGIIDEGLGLLAPDVRSAVVLRDMQELSNQEAAEATNLSVPAFKSRLHRGRVLLRKYLEGAAFDWQRRQRIEGPAAPEARLSTPPTLI